jgi:hypothetical protein
VAIAAPSAETEHDDRDHHYGARRAITMRSIEGKGWRIQIAAARSGELGEDRGLRFVALLVHY